ncbi:MAG: hypothetical protein NVS2B3_05890 [Vulcanimicrobiaceae bacterium]
MRGTTSRLRSIGIALATLGLAAALSAVARADQRYVVSGKDSFAIGAGDIRSEVTYAGTQTLSLKRHGRVTRFKAHVAYTRSEGAAATDTTSDYVADVLPSGETRDTADRDPDYLTVLNQPFSAQLDRQTLADLQHLGGALPFDFPSPFTGSSLHGYLKHIGNAMMGSHRSIGVRFESAGTMKGALPDRPGLTLSGTIAMRGTAYYDLDSALLLALDTTVTISGNVSNRSSNDPVTIVYVRTIRADVPHAAQSAGKP